MRLQGEAALESLLEAIKDNVDPLDAAPEKRAEDTPTGAAVLQQPVLQLLLSVYLRFATPSGALHLNYLSDHPPPLKHLN